MTSAYAYAPAPIIPRDPTAVMGKRVVAYVIDLVVVGSIFVALLAASKHRTFTDSPSGLCSVIRQNFDGACVQLGTRTYTWEGGDFARSCGLAVLVALLNNVLLQAVTGASLGKMVMGLRVVDRDGRTANAGRQIVRWLLLVVDAGLCFLGFFVAAFTRPHRRIGDLVGGTYVVDAMDAGAPIVVSPVVPAPTYVPPPPGAGTYVPPPPATGPWGAPPPPAPPPPWKPAAPAPPAPSNWGAPTEQPTGWGTVPPTSTPPPPAPAPEEPPAAPSWWERPPAEDDEPRQ